MGVTQHNIQEFRRRIRLIADKKNPSKREILGLLFDVYEIFVVMAEDRDTAEMMSMFDIPPGKVYKVSPEKFDEVVTHDKNAKGRAIEENSPGQYL